MKRPRMKWQIRRHGAGELKALSKSLDAGWEPFAVSGFATVWLRRQVPR